MRTGNAPEAIPSHRLEYLPRVDSNEGLREPPNDKPLSTLGVSSADNANAKSRGWDALPPDRTSTAHWKTLFPADEEWRASKRLRENGVLAQYCVRDRGHHSM